MGDRAEPILVNGIEVLEEPGVATMTRQEFDPSNVSVRKLIGLVPVPSSCAPCPFWTKADVVLAPEEPASYSCSALGCDVQTPACNRTHRTRYLIKRIREVEAAREGGGWRTPSQPLPEDGLILVQDLNGVHRLARPGACTPSSIRRWLPVPD